MIQERLEFAKKLACEAGRLTLEGFGKVGQMPKEGSDGYDIATEYDFRAEELVKNRILKEFGEPVLGEEDGLIGDPQAARTGLWILDPIDGTFNYQRGLPMYGVSIAFCEKGIPVCGAIFLPALDQLFFAAQGSGAFLVEHGMASPVPIHVGQERELARLVLSLADKDTYRLAMACAGAGIPWRSLRYLMCAVFGLAYVAAGRIDAFIDVALNLWDCAAADILLREAGSPGVVDYQRIPIFPEYVNRRFDLGDARKFPCVAASSRELFADPLMAVIASVISQSQVEGCDV
jgi:myo-inositol-1(or 4)-monophosphatase